MHTLLDAARPGRPAPTLIVMLPAAYSQPEAFVEAGFVRALRRRGLDIDLAFAALELQHVGDRSVLGRLHEELVGPARARGTEVWMGGISLGGYIALRYAQRQARGLAGLCLLAPYLGSHIVTSEIERAGGVQHWNPGEPADDDEERRIWCFLKSRGAGLPMHLGLGAQDRFGRRHRLLAAALEPGAVDTVPGAHDWPTWARLWERFLDARFAPRPALAIGPTHG